MNTKKSNPILLRFLLSILALVTAFSFTGCNKVRISDYQSMVKEDVYNQYDMFKSDLYAIKSEDAMLEYFYQWGKDHKISCEKIGNDGFAMNLKASKNMEKAESTTIQCSVDSSNIAGTAKTAAMALVSMENTTTHGDVTVLFTKAGNGNSTAAKIPASYTKTDNFISLTERSTPRLFIGSAAQAGASITRKVNTGSPQSGTAFKISISGCEGGDSAQRDRRHPNPIMYIGAVLNDCRKSGIVMEIASFTGGEHSWTFPQKSQAVICIASSEATKFQNQFESAIDYYKDKYLKYESKMEFTIEETKLPETTVTSDSTYSILSLLYTLHDGVFHPDSDDEEDKEEDSDTLKAFSNVGTIAVKDGSLDIGIFSRSVDKQIFKNMLQTYKQTASLSDATFTVDRTIPLWKGSKKDSLVTTLTSIADKNNIKLIPDSTFKTTDAAIFADKNKKLHVVSMGVDMQDATELTASLVIFLDGNGQNTDN